jgi:predicted nucleic acid-binding protein
MISPVESPEMVDTQVLVYASMATARTSRDPGIQGMHQTSLDLLHRLPVIRVSVIAWFEFIRLLRTEDEKRMAALLEKVVVERVDRPIVEFAATLLKERRAAEKVCDCCLGSARSEKCTKCGKAYSAQQRLNDALIVSTANVLETVKTLWSFDRGVLELGTYCKLCDVQRPQSDIPLFDPEANPAIGASLKRSHLASVPVSQLGTEARDDKASGSE